MVNVAMPGCNRDNYRRRIHTPMTVSATLNAYPPIHRLRGSDAGKGGQRGRDVDVQHQVAVGRPGLGPRRPDHERDPDGFFVGPDLGEEPMLAEQEPVVGCESDDGDDPNGLPPTDTPPS